ENYCCSDPQKKLSVIHFSLTRIGVIIILFIICWVCPCCCLYKRFRSPRPVTTTSTVGGWYLPYQALPNNPPYGGQPMPTGPPRSYQEAVGPGHPVPIQVAYDGGQAMYPLQSSLPTDYTSPQPVYNPAYLESQIAPVQLVKTSN
uniref:Si:dkey-42i9.8 n=1 Tax=Sinocyclocheilus grahami TaxID=75366 RepID=A0A672QMP5_SINGR